MRKHCLEFKIKEVDKYFSFGELGGRKGNASLVMAVIGFAKEKSQRASIFNHLRQF